MLHPTPFLLNIPIPTSLDCISAAGFDIELLFVPTDFAGFAGSIGFWSTLDPFNPSDSTVPSGFDSTFRGYAICNVNRSPYPDTLCGR